jgi:hypothetical protein
MAFRLNFWRPSTKPPCRFWRPSTKLDLEATARGEVSRAGVAIEAARRAAEKMRGQGNVGAARLLEEHIELAAAANELGKHQDATMPKEEFDLAADMLTAAGVLLPQKTCLLALQKRQRLWIAPC